MDLGLLKLSTNRSCFRSNAMCCYSYSTSTNTGRLYL